MIEDAVPPLRDYARSRAVVMGVWDYAALDPVPAAEHSLREMSELLCGPLCGWPGDRVLVLANESEPGNLPDRLITAFDGVTDVALFYFVGHGQITPDDQLSLALTQTRSEPKRRAATSLRFSDVRQALQDSDATTKIVILDCCFAGLATKPVLAGLAGDVLERTAGTGAYTMAATSAYTTAWYEDEPGLNRPQTYFTKYLVDLVKTGIPGQPSRLGLDALFLRLRENLAADGRPVPQRRAVDDARGYLFAYNAAPPQTHHDPEREVARLSRQLAEAEAQVQALRAEAAEREKAVTRLAESGQDTAGRQSELQEQIDVGTRKLDEIRAARAAAVVASVSAPAAEDLTPDQTERPAKPASRSRAKAARWLAAVATAAVTAILLVQLLPGSPTSSTGTTNAAGTTKPAEVVITAITYSLAEKVPDQKGYTPQTVAFGSNGILAIGTSQDNSTNDPVKGSTLLWNTATNKAVGAPLRDPGGTGVRSMAWEPHSTTFPDHAGGGVAALAWEPGSTTLAVGDENGTTYLWDAASKQPILPSLPSPQKATVNAMAFNPAGTILAVAMSTEVIDLWNTRTWKLIGKPLPDPALGPFVAVTWATSGTTLAVGDLNGRTYLWEDINASTPTTYLQSSGNWVSSVAFGQGLLAIGIIDGGGTAVWNPATSRKLATIPVPGNSDVAADAFNPAGNLAVADDNGYTYLWNIQRTTTSLSGPALPR